MMRVSADETAKRARGEVDDTVCRRAAGMDVGGEDEQPNSDTSSPRSRLINDVIDRTRSPVGGAHYYSTYCATRWDDRAPS